MSRHDDDALWAAIADPTRRRLLDALLAQGRATATRLAGDLPVTRQAVAKHLAVLDRAGLVEGRRQGREVRYVVRPERLDDAARAMSGIADEWDRRLAAIKRRQPQLRLGRGLTARRLLQVMQQSMHAVVAPDVPAAGATLRARR